MIRILIIDDDVPMLNFMGQVVSSLGHELVTAQTGVQACTLLDSDVFKMILMDPRLPNTSGKLLLHKIRTSTNHNHVPVLIVTTETDIAVADEMRLCGADGYLTKPFEPETLASHIENLLPPVCNVNVA